jgi:hypothetical protein
VRRRQPHRAAAKLPSSDRYFRGLTALCTDQRRRRRRREKNRNTRALSLGVEATALSPTGPFGGDRKVSNRPASARPRAASGCFLDCSAPCSDPAAAFG